MPKPARILPIALLCAAAGLLPAHAGLKSFRGPLIQEKAATISVQHDGIRISSYHFLRTLRHVEKLFKGGGPAIRLAVANESTDPREFALAIALFDDAGNLVGVASEDLKMKGGASDEIDLTFRHLNRFAPHASSIQLSVETRL